MPSNNISVIDALAGFSLWDIDMSHWTKHISLISDSGYEVVLHAVAHICFDFTPAEPTSMDKEGWSVFSVDSGRLDGGGFFLHLNHRIHNSHRAESHPKLTCTCSNIEVRQFDASEFWMLLSNEVQHSKPSFDAFGTAREPTFRRPGMREFHDMLRRQRKT